MARDAAVDSPPERKIAVVPFSFGEKRSRPDQALCTKQHRCPVFLVLGSPSPIKNTAVLNSQIPVRLLLDRLPS